VEEIVTYLNKPRSDRTSFEKVAPNVVRALAMLDKAVEDSGLEKTLTELIKIRSSQINGCAFCVQYHLNIARKVGLAPAKMDLVAVWRDAGIFCERERTALAWTEALTQMSHQHVTDTLYEELRTSFTEHETAFLTAAISSINAWNRIAGALQFAPDVSVL